MKQTTAIFDIDGVIIQNPDDALEQTVADAGYWTRHWNNPDLTKVNKEVVQIAQALVLANVSVIALTARPERFRTVTQSLLVKANFPFSGLMMLPGSIVPVSSAAWKQEMVRKLANDTNVLFMMEDYRPNAEAVRSVVPVLLYERKKVSKHLDALCHVCGGLARCYCGGQTD